MNIIHLLQMGQIAKTNIATNRETAEAIFDSIAESLGIDMEELSEDYASRLDEVNTELEPKGLEIIWLEDIEVETEEPILNLTERERNLIVYSIVDHHQVIQLKGNKREYLRELEALIVKIERL